MENLTSLAPFALVGVVLVYMIMRRRTKTRHHPNANKPITKDWRNDNVGGASDGGMDGGAD